MNSHQCTLVIHNKRGLHARASAKLATLANQFPCEILIGSEQDTMKNAKNILEVMMLAASPGTCLQLHTRGEQAEQALQQICQLADNKFDEDS